MRTSLSHFNAAEDPGLWDHAARIQGESFFLCSTFVEMPSNAYQEVCLLADSKRNQQ